MSNPSSEKRVKGYHLHVYFETSTKPQAMSLRESIEATLSKAVLGRIHEEPVAFHPRPMFQVALPVSDLGLLLGVVMAKRGDLSVLLHPVHGDVWEEHTSDAMWLGTPLELDKEKLRKSSGREVGSLG